MRQRVIILIIGVLLTTVISCREPESSQRDRYTITSLDQLTTMEGVIIRKYRTYVRGISLRVLKVKHSDGRTIVYVLSDLLYQNPCIRKDAKLPLVCG